MLRLKYFCDALIQNGSLLRVVATSTQNNGSGLELYNKVLLNRFCKQ